MYAALLAPLMGFSASWHIMGEWLLCCLAGSLFPDIDTKSRGQKYFYRMMFLVVVVLTVQQRFYCLALASVGGLIPLLTNHRGLFHRFWFVIGFPILVWCAVAHYWPVQAQPLLFDTVFFIAGALSHLMIDFYVVPCMRSCGLYKKHTGGWARRS